MKKFTSWPYGHRGLLPAKPSPGNRSGKHQNAANTLEDGRKDGNDYAAGLKISAFATTYSVILSWPYQKISLSLILAKGHPQQF